MSAKNTWLWVLTAAVLFAFIYFFQRHPAQPPAGPARLLPGLEPAAVKTIQVRPGGPVQLEIRAERTNDGWQVTEPHPLNFKADTGKVESLLDFLAQLKPGTYLAPAELRNRSTDEEFGFATPQGSVILLQGGHRFHIVLGARTAPGDQVFVNVVGLGGVYAVDAELLKLLPGKASDWRDTALVHLEDLAFNRLAITNNGKGFVAFALRSDTANGLWGMSWPFRARADNTRLNEGLRQLQAVRIGHFVSDEPKPALDSFGLAPPALEIALAQDTNSAALLQFGKSPTNDAASVYARRAPEDAIFTVPKAPLTAWQREDVNEFRDPHLVTATEPIDRIEGQAPTAFSLERQPDGAWRILPEGLPADPALVGDFVSALTNSRIVQFVKDVVNPPDLPGFGLASPVRHFVLETATTNAAGSATNLTLADLSFGFGTNAAEKVFARRADETAVYAISTNDFVRFPTEGWPLRNRQLWEITETDIAAVTIREQGKARELLHNGRYKWSLALGSQGIINDLAVEDTVRGLAHAAVLAWLARGETNRASCGVTENGYEISFVLKNGARHAIQFGNRTPAGVCAAVDFGGQVWLGLFPADLYDQLAYALTAQ